jgi:hypothetical protein
MIKLRELLALSSHGCSVHFTDIDNDGCAFTFNVGETTHSWLPFAIALLLTLLGQSGLLSPSPPFESRKGTHHNGNMPHNSAAVVLILLRN